MGRLAIRRLYTPDPLKGEGCDPLAPLPAGRQAYKGEDTPQE
jgi:hypothetical protein